MTFRRGVFKCCQPLETEYNLETNILGTFPKFPSFFNLEAYPYRKQSHFIFLLSVCAICILHVVCLCLVLNFRLKGQLLPNCTKFYWDKHYCHTQPCGKYARMRAVEADLCAFVHLCVWIRHECAINSCL